MLGIFQSLPLPLNEQGQHHDHDCVANGSCDPRGFEDRGGRDYEDSEDADGDTGLAPGGAHGCEVIWGGRARFASRIWRNDWRHPRGARKRIVGDQPPGSVADGRRAIRAPVNAPRRWTRAARGMPRRRDAGMLIRPSPPELAQPDGGAENLRWLRIRRAAWCVWRVSRWVSRTGESGGTRARVRPQEEGWEGSVTRARDNASARALTPGAPGRDLPG